MAQTDNGGSWSDTLRDVFNNGLNSAIDRYLGPETAYQPTANVPVGGAQPVPESSYQPVDVTPGERQPVPGVSQQTMILGGAGLVLALGLVVLLVRK